MKISTTACLIYINAMEGTLPTAPAMKALRTQVHGESELTR